MKKPLPKLIIGTFLTLGIWLITLSAAKGIEGGLSPIPSVILTLMVWSLLFGRKGGGSGDCSIDSDPGGDS